MTFPTTQSAQMPARRGVAGVTLPTRTRLLLAGGCESFRRAIYATHALPAVGAQRGRNGTVPLLAGSHEANERTGRWSLNPVVIDNLPGAATSGNSLPVRRSMPGQRFMSAKLCREALKVATLARTASGPGPEGEAGSDPAALAPFMLTHEPVTNRAVRATIRRFDLGWRPRYSTASNGGMFFGCHTTDNNGLASYLPAWTKPTSRRLDAGLRKGQRYDPTRQPIVL